jgi:SOS-response transcriptional repressor LexA
MLFIQRYVVEHGRAPSVRDLADGIELQSTSAAHRILVELERRGFISRSASAHRSITILKTIPDDRFEEAAKAVCAAHGCTDPASIAKARDLIFNSLVRSAA